MTWFQFPRNEVTSKLEALYSQIPEWEQILNSVKIGEQEFVHDLEARGLNEFGINTSRVHPYSDVEIQAFILGIPSKMDPEEISAKSYLTFGAHWLDDFFDNPDLAVKPKEMSENRRNIKIVLENMGRIGEVGSLLAVKALYPEGVYRGLHRMLYGGLVQRSQSSEERKKLIQEYRGLAIQSVDQHIAEEIKGIQPETYWTTNKTVQEFINAAEDHFDFTVAELWNLIYAPALYFHDVAEEEKSGELNFGKEESPRLDEMLKMIRIGAKYLSEFTDEKRSLRVQQLQFLLKVFQEVLPALIVAEYKSIIQRY